MNGIAVKEEIAEAILKLDKWRDIEYILDSIFNTRNLVFTKWLKDNSNEIIRKLK